MASRIDFIIVFFFSSRRRHTRWNCDWSSDVCSSDLLAALVCAVIVATAWGAAPNAITRPAQDVTITSASLRGAVDPKGNETRSEERRVGKECRSRWSPDQ